MHGSEEQGEGDELATGPMGLLMAVFGLAFVVVLSLVLILAFASDTLLDYEESEIGPTSSKAEVPRFSSIEFSTSFVEQLSVKIQSRADKVANLIFLSYVNEPVADLALNLACDFESQGILQHSVFIADDVVSFELFKQAGFAQTVIFTDDSFLDGLSLDESNLKPMYNKDYLRRKPWIMSVAQQALVKAIWIDPEAHFEFSMTNLFNTISSLVLLKQNFGRWDIDFDSGIIGLGYSKVAKDFLKHWMIGASDEFSGYSSPVVFALENLKDSRPRMRQLEVDSPLFLEKIKAKFIVPDNGTFLIDRTKAHGEIIKLLSFSGHWHITCRLFVSNSLSFVDCLSSRSTSMCDSIPREGHHLSTRICSSLKSRYKKFGAEDHSFPETPLLIPRNELLYRNDVATFNGQRRCPGSCFRDWFNEYVDSVHAIHISDDFRENLVRLLVSRATSDGMVIILSLSLTYVDLTLNVLTNLALLGLDRHAVIICEDRASFLVLERNGYFSQILLSDYGRLQREFFGNFSAEHGDNEYSSYTILRPWYLALCWDAGLRSIWMDQDVILSTNIMNDIRQSFHSSFDFVFITEYSRHSAVWGDLCSGFLSIPPNCRGKDFLLQWMKQMTKSPLSGINQPAFNHAIKNSHINLVPLKASRFRAPENTAAVLSGWKYCSGLSYWSNKCLNSEARLVHNNFIKGHLAKVERFYCSDMWMLPCFMQSPSDAGIVHGDAMKKAFQCTDANSKPSLNISLLSQQGREHWNHKCPLFLPSES